MSVLKLLARIVAPSDFTGESSTLHDHTYGITSGMSPIFALSLSPLTLNTSIPMCIFCLSDPLTQVRHCLRILFKCTYIAHSPLLSLR